jgi:hypothetical protein
VIQVGAEIKENWRDIGASTSLEISDVQYCNCFKNRAEFEKVRGLTTNANFSGLADIVIGEQDMERKAQTAASVEVDPNTTIALAKAACKRKRAPMAKNLLPMTM